MTYEEHHVALVTYLRAKVEAQDWHGVSDAANDLRVLEATKPGSMGVRLTTGLDPMREGAFQRPYPFTIDNRSHPLDPKP